MLWTDADFIVAADLLSVDPDIVAAAKSLDLPLVESSQGCIRRGLEEAGRQLENILVSFTTYISSNDLSANHNAAVFYTGSMPNQRRRATLDQVVVSGRNENYWSDIKQWAVNLVLKRFYLSASNKDENDRYDAKLEQFTNRDVLEAWPQLKQSGIPIVLKPMPAPAAVQLRNPGSFTASSVILGGAVATGDYDVAISYVDQSKYVSQASQGNAESNVSARKKVTLASGHGLSIDITSLNPPNGALGPGDISRGFVVPLNATGWNIFVGLTGQTLFLQNPTPIPIATKVSALATDPVLSGSAAGIGQYAELYISVHNLIKRA